MKTLKLLNPTLDYLGQFKGPYKPNGTAFGYCSEPTKEGTVRLRSKFVNCRDELCCHLEKKFRNKAFEKIPIRKTRFLVFTSEADEKIINKTLSFLNTLEKKYKWQPSIVRKVDFSNCDNVSLATKNSTSKLYAFFSSPRWIRSPHMISLYALIIRVCIRHPTIRSIKTFKEFVDRDFSLISGRDSVHIKEVFPMIPTIMSNYNKLFKDLPIKANYTKEISNQELGAYAEGPLNLVRGSSRHKTLNKRFSKLVGRREF
jgi:hypothetical protein